MKKSSAFSLSLIALLFGIIVGFILSPVKFGIANQNNSGNNTYYPVKKETESDTCE